MKPIRIHYVLYALLVGIIVMSCTTTNISNRARELAIRFTATAIQAECNTVTVGFMGNDFRADVDKELERRGDTSRTSPPNC